MWALKPENAEKFLKTIQNLTDSLFGGLGKITDSDYNPNPESDEP